MTLVLLGSTLTSTDEGVTVTLINDIGMRLLSQPVALL